MFLFDQVQFGARGGCKRPGGTPWHAANVFARALVPCGLFCALETSVSPAKTQMWMGCAPRRRDEAGISSFPHPTFSAMQFDVTGS